MQRCRACGNPRLLDVEQLEVGILGGAEPAARCVVAPACTRCGYVELLVGLSESALDGDGIADGGANPLLFEPRCDHTAKADQGPGDGAEIGADCGDSVPVEEISVWFQRRLLDDELYSAPAWRA
jgi:hypothetical protein